MSAYILSTKDIASLAKTIVATCSGEKVPFFAEDFVDAMIKYDWRKDRNPRVENTSSEKYKITTKNYQDFLSNYLMELNTDSVNGRYNDDTVPEMVNDDEGVLLNVDDLHKGLRSYLYQSCGGGCDETYLYVVVDMFAKAVKRTFNPNNERGNWM